MIEILNRQTRHRINERRLRRLLAGLIRLYRLRSPVVALALVGPAAIRKLNREFLKEDAVTDVLSFPIGQRASDGQFYLGDIIIAPSRAQRQSREKGHSLARELDILTVHGFLHLLGYDHFAGIEAEEAKVCRRLLRH